MKKISPFDLSEGVGGLTFAQFNFTFSSVPLEDKAGTSRVGKSSISQFTKETKTTLGGCVFSR